MASITIKNPYNQEPIETLELDDESSSKAKLTLLHDFFYSDQPQLAAHERQKVLRRLAQLIEDHSEALARLACEEGGKPIEDSRIEIMRAAQGTAMAADYITQLHGEEIPMDLAPQGENKIAFTRTEPKGIVLAISAFNHPFNLIVHQVIPAIAAGCPVLVKPSLDTPLSCIKLIQLLYEAGLPEHYCQYTLTENHVTEQLVMSQKIRFMSFIGSSNVGWYLRSKLAPGVDCALEHGGAAPVIIDADTDLDKVLPKIVKGAFYHAGQVCVSVQRLYIHNKIYKQTCKKLQQLVNELIVGDPQEEQTQVGPLIRPAEIERIDRWIKEAVAEGGKILTGGEKISDTAFQPTLITEPKAKSKVTTQEIFGPVLCLYSYQNYQEAIEAANAVPYAFQASVYTNNINVALDCSQRLKATAVMVNEQTAFRVDWMPFGGSELSGLKLGGIPQAMHDLVNKKMTIFSGATHE